MWRTSSPYRRVHHNTAACEGAIGSSDGSCWCCPRDVVSGAGRKHPQHKRCTSVAKRNQQGMGDLQHAAAEHQNRKSGQLAGVVLVNVQGTDTLAAAVVTLATLTSDTTRAVLQQL